MSHPSSGLFPRGVRRSRLIGLLYKRRLTDEYGAFGETRNGRTSRSRSSTRRKAVPVALCPPQTPHDDLRSNPGSQGGKPVTNHLSYSTVRAELSMKQASKTDRLIFMLGECILLRMYSHRWMFNGVHNTFVRNYICVTFI
jgi:hypothetical protein